MRDVSLAATKQQWKIRNLQDRRGGVRSWVQPRAGCGLNLIFKGLCHVNLFPPRSECQHLSPLWCSEVSKRESSALLTKTVAQGTGSSVCNTREHFEGESNQLKSGIFLISPCMCWTKELYSKSIKDLFNICPPKGFFSQAQPSVTCFYKVHAGWGSSYLTI